MAIVRKSLEGILRSDRRFDHTKIASTTDDDIAEQIAADPDTAPEINLEMLSEPENLRRQLGMTQDSFAASIGVPVATLRQWEQERGSIDPAARSLLILVARDPEGALAALAAARAAA